MSEPTDVPWLTGDEQTAWIMLVGLFMGVPSAIDTQLKRDSGVNFFEYSVMVALSPEKSLQMTTLSKLTGGSLSRLSHAVSRLERQGWVQRQVQTGEVRCTEASLTDSGREKLASAAPGHVREVRRVVFDVLTPEQVGQLREICRRMVMATDSETARFLAELARQEHTAP